MKTNDELFIFTRNVSRLRKENKYTKKEMAQIMHISVSTLDKIEKGVFPERLGINNVICLCEYFKILPKDIFK